MQLYHENHGNFEVEVDGLSLQKNYTEFHVWKAGSTSGPTSAAKFTHSAEKGKDDVLP